MGCSTFIPLAICCPLCLHLSLQSQWLSGPLSSWGWFPLLHGFLCRTNKWSASYLETHGTFPEDDESKPPQTCHQSTQLGPHDFQLHLGKPWFQHLIWQFDYFPCLKLQVTDLEYHPIFQCTLFFQGTLSFETKHSFAQESKLCCCLFQFACALRA